MTGYNSQFLRWSPRTEYRLFVCLQYLPYSVLGNKMCLLYNVPGPARLESEDVDPPSAISQMGIYHGFFWWSLLKHIVLALFTNTVSVLRTPTVRSTSRKYSVSMVKCDPEYTHPAKRILRGSLLRSRTSTTR